MSYGYSRFLRHIILCLMILSILSIGSLFQHERWDDKQTTLADKMCLIAAVLHNFYHTTILTDHYLCAGLLGMDQITYDSSQGQKNEIQDLYFEPQHKVHLPYIILICRILSLQNKKMGSKTSSMFYMKCIQFHIVFKSNIIFKALCIYEIGLFCFILLHTV